MIAPLIMVGWWVCISTILRLGAGVRDIEVAASSEPPSRINDQGVICSLGAVLRISNGAKAWIQPNQSSIVRNQTSCEAIDVHTVRRSSFLPASGDQVSLRRSGISDTPHNTFEQTSFNRGGVVVRHGRTEVRIDTANIDLATDQPSV